MDTKPVEDPTTASFEKLLEVLLLASGVPKSEDKDSLRHSYTRILTRLLGKFNVQLVRDGLNIGVIVSDKNSQVQFLAVRKGFDKTKPHPTIIKFGRLTEQQAVDCASLASLPSPKEPQQFTYLKPTFDFVRPDNDKWFVADTEKRLFVSMKSANVVCVEYGFRNLFEETGIPVKDSARHAFACALLFHEHTPLRSLAESTWRSTYNNGVFSQDAKFVHYGLYVRNSKVVDFVLRTIKVLHLHIKQPIRLQSAFIADLGLTPEEVNAMFDIYQVQLKMTFTQEVRNRLKTVGEFIEYLITNASGKLDTDATDIFLHVWLHQTLQPGLPKLEFVRTNFWDPKIKCVLVK